MYQQSKGSIISVIGAYRFNH